MAQIIYQQVNEFRRSQGLEPLALESVISVQANQHSETMAQSSSLSHDGFEQRINTIRQSLPLRSAAENVAFNSGFNNPAEQAVEGWKNSPGHRQNMLGNFSKTGIGISQNEQGEYYFTQIFGQP
ncbi:MAG: CAP domain-containing protein [Leptolyngbyaceae cyanobacterium SM1_1_3]|nr:CAP domain-containing protein [Leptolyngbyaceae cyanobacterium SM1_1_3]NJN03603.1 CAP domain-containing protein [Leptolyngbyaceae cyanobacterium RM1_1_2]NJO12023.1 CAP domain-containing protein [Leptolyngbyaceae cyanobacterium SL_1_1]